MEIIDPAANRLAIYGAGGHGRVAAEIAETSGWREIEFFADGGVPETRSNAWKFSGGANELLNRKSNFGGAFVAIGDCVSREYHVLNLLNHDYPIVSLSHRSAIISPRATYSTGCLFSPGSIVNISSALGVGCIVNTAATVDHDCEIADFVHIAPGAHLAGGVRVGRRSWIGIGAIIRQGIRIGSDVMVGAGSVVVRDVGDGQTVFGSPARLIT